MTVASDHARKEGEIGDPIYGDSFSFCLLTAPIDKVFPWFAGYVRGWEGPSPDDKPRVRWMMREYPSDTVVPRLPESVEPTYRLIEVCEGDDFCLLEVNFPGEFELNSRSIHYFVGCSHVEFSNRVLGARLSGRKVAVRENRHLLRFVGLGSQDTGNPNTTGRLRFWTRGDPQLWEQLDRYTNKRVLDRLPLDLLVDYMAAFGLDFEIWKSRKYHRVVECRPRGEGTSLDEFDPQAREFQKLVDEDLAKLEQGILPES